MKYPIEIEKNIKEIETIISSWPVRKNICDVINWVLQFDNEDFDLAFRILKHINIVGPEELNSALAISYSKLNRHAKNKDIKLSVTNTMYAAIGGASKSGAMISYNFRLINELSAANFLDEDSIKYIEEGKISNLVLVDDIIATGDQSSKELIEIAERVIPLGIKNIFVLTAVGFKSGLKKVQDTQLADVFSALEYDERDCVNSLDSEFYNGLPYNQRKLYFEKFSKYKGLGYQGVGALIAFYYNTPNCTINSVWADSFGWIPLFQRISNIAGIDKHYPELDKALSKTPPKSPEVDGKNCLTIFVEGKLEEIFFEYLGKKYNKFNLESLDVISIGPFYSEKLINSLKNISPNYVLITEKETEETAHSRRVKEVVCDNDLLVIDNITTYFDIDKIVESGQFNLNIEDETDDKFTYLELKLLKRVPASVRQENIEILTNNYLNEDKVNELIEEIKRKTKK